MMNFERVVMMGYSGVHEGDKKAMLKFQLLRSLSLRTATSHDRVACFAYFSTVIRASELAKWLELIS